MDLNRILELREEKEQLNKELQLSGRQGLSDRAKYAAMRRIAEINEQITQIENPQYAPIDPLESLSLEELKVIYEEMKAEYLGFDPMRFGSGKPLRSNDPRKQAALMTIQTRIQRLEAEEAAKGDE